MPVAVDEEGVVVDGLPPLDYLFVTPSHQSPTTVTLSLQRREQPLRRAEQGDFVIIEDDYEAENLYHGTPMPALKSLDKGGRVIYVGSLSKSLSPALRLGYIVAPRALIDELRVLRHAMVRHPSAFLQHAYALFLSLGHHEAHARRVNQAMLERVAQVDRFAARTPAGFHLPPAPGRRIAVGAGAGVAGCRCAGRRGAPPRRADRGRQRVLCDVAPALPFSGCACPPLPPIRSMQALRHWHRQWPNWPGRDDRVRARGHCCA